MTDIVKNALSRKELDLSPVHAEALFGLALGLSTPIGSEYIKDMTDLIQRAANAGYVPAQGICSQILRAHKRPLPPVSVLRNWERNSLGTGYFFHTEPSYLTQEEAAEARDEFRQSGGHCRDSFMSISSVLDTASNSSRLADFISEHGPFAAIDLDGNTITHVVAALGNPHSLQSILKKFPEQILKRNDNGETLLYKACQAGQMDILRILRDTGIELTSIATLKDKVTPLHWLFMFKDGCLSEACEYLMGPNKENINARMVPETGSSSTYHPNDFPMLH
jgi:Ankyrin repeats (3 copies)